MLGNRVHKGFVYQTIQTAGVNNLSALRLSAGELSLPGVPTHPCKVPLHPRDKRCALQLAENKIITKRY